mgnify:FL=1
MNILLSDILARKAEPEIFEHGQVEDDGVGNTRLFLVMRGDTATSSIKYDKEGVREKIREDIKQEKKALKGILNEEFGLFQKDSLQPVKSEKAGNSEHFQIQWEEQPVGKKKENPEKREKKKKQPGFVIEWDKDTISGK